MTDTLFLKCFVEEAQNDETKVLILTGTGRYYCAGVDLSAMIKPMHPKTLHDIIYEKNKALFESFLKFPKPILVAANGPAVGASVTSATLCDAIIAVDNATFSTPFNRLGVPPEGCSSYHFPHIMGAEAAFRILEQGWQPTAKEALEIGMIEHISTTENLENDAQTIAENWIKEGKTRQIKKEDIDQIRSNYIAVNVRESQELAEAFLSSKFILQQYKFLKSKGKTNAAITFYLLNLLRPIWSKML